jgi:hypothetical protein
MLKRGPGIPPLRGHEYIDRRAASLTGVLPNVINANSVEQLWARCTLLPGQRNGVAAYLKIIGETTQCLNWFTKLANCS